jgi:hypothetical protein
MKNYIVYNSKGEILKTGICPDDMIDIQAKADEIVMEGQCNDIEEKVVDGKIEKKTEEEIAASKTKWELSPEEKLIQKKMGDLLRQMAIDELKKEGKVS